MIYLLKIFFRDKKVFMPLILSGILQIFIWWYIFSHLRVEDAHYFLHYNIIFGVDLVGKWWRIIFLPIFGLVMIVLNYGLALYFYNQDKLLSRLMTITTPLFQFFLSIAVYLIVDLNI